MGIPLSKMVNINNVWEELLGIHPIEEGIYDYIKEYGDRLDGGETIRIAGEVLAPEQTKGVRKLCWAYIAFMLSKFEFDVLKLIETGERQVRTLDDVRTIVTNIPSVLLQKLEVEVTEENVLELLRETSRLENDSALVALKA